MRCPLSYNNGNYGRRAGIQSTVFVCNVRAGQASWVSTGMTPILANLDILVEYLRKTQAERSRPSKCNTVSFPSSSPTTMFCNIGLVLGKSKLSSVLEFIAFCAHIYDQYCTPPMAFMITHWPHGCKGTFI